MDKRKSKSGGVLGSLLALPFDFISGYLVGLLAPVAALAAIVGGIYLLTRKVPFLSHTWPDRDAEGEQHLALKLMPPEQAQAVFVREKERISADLNAMGAEIKVLAEQAKGQPPEAGGTRAAISEED